MRRNLLFFNTGGISPTRIALSGFSDFSSRYPIRKHIHELDMLFRSYTRLDDEKQDGLQIYQGQTLIVDIDVPKNVRILGYSAPCVYATNGLDGIRESFDLYKFKVE